MLRVLHGCWAMLSCAGRGIQEHGGPRSALLPKTSTHEPLRTQMQRPSGATYSFKGPSRKYGLSRAAMWPSTRQ